MNTNPWVRLPATPPYVLPEDGKAVRDFNARARGDHQLQIDLLLPEPFLGDPAAPILLLSNNPGIGKYVALRRTREFMARTRDCIGLKSPPYPFIYLESEFRDAGGWWLQKLKCLIDSFDVTKIARSVCNIVYFPYPSKRFAHWRCELPSQEFGFRLVQAGVARGAIIVLMRKGQLKRWVQKVPGLQGYGNLVLLRNPQMPSISPRNCEPGDYEKIVHAIARAEIDSPTSVTSNSRLDEVCSHLSSPVTV